MEVERGYPPLRSNDLCPSRDAMVSSRVISFVIAARVLLGRPLRLDHACEKPPHLRLRLPLLFGFHSVREHLAHEPRSNLWEIDFVFSFSFLFHASSECDVIAFAFGALRK